MLLANLTIQFKAVEMPVAEVDVEQDEMRRSPRDHLQSAFGIIDLIDLIALRFHEEFDHLPVIGVILDHKNAHGESSLKLALTNSLSFLNYSDQRLVSIVQRKVLVENRTHRNVCPTVALLYQRRSQ